MDGPHHGALGINIMAGPLVMPYFLCKPCRSDIMSNNFQPIIVIYKNQQLPPVRHWSVIFAFNIVSCLPIVDHI